MVFRFQQPGMATNFRRGAGGFHPGGAGADDHHVSVAIHAPHFIGVTVNNIRVNRTAQRARAGDAMVGAADVAGDTFAHQTLFSALHFLHPLRLGNQTAANGDKIGIAAGEDIFGYLRSANIAGDDRGFMEFIAHRAGEIALPAILQRHLIDLQIQVVVLRRRDVDDIDLLLAELKNTQGIFEGIAALEEVVGADAQADRKTRPHAGANLIDNQTQYPSAIFDAAAKFISALIKQRR